MKDLRRLFALALLPLALAACAAPTPDSLDWRQAELNSHRAVARAYSEIPFENGPMSVIATEGDRIATYRLVPCGGGSAICADGLQGRAGQLQVTADYHIVTGLYGRTFLLAPGGRGHIRYPDGTFIPLAWDSVDRPVDAFESGQLDQAAAILDQD